MKELPKESLSKELQELANDLLELDYNHLSPRRKRIIQAIAEGESVAVDPNKSYAQTLTFGQKVSDAIATFGGSWPFLLGAITFLIGWIIINYKGFFGEAFDPYPFILLNLILSMLAALQAPIIMMAQNRQLEKDRCDASHNYEVCLKMELDLTRLHNRLDDLEEKIYQNDDRP